jgi:hypothetical protein
MFDTNIRPMPAAKRNHSRRMVRDSRTKLPGVSDGLGGDGPSAFLRPMTLAQADRLYSLHSQAA